MEAERKFISLQVRHESLEKNHSITKQRYARLKVSVHVQTFVGQWRSNCVRNNSRPSIFYLLLLENFFVKIGRLLFTVYICSIYLKLIITSPPTHTHTHTQAEMSALFCRYSSTSADSNHLQRLQRALSQSQSENEGLRNKMRKLETQLSDSTSLQDQRKLVSAFVDFGDKAEYIQFLEHEIDQAK